MKCESNDASSVLWERCESKVSSSATEKGSSKEVGTETGMGRGTTFRLRLRLGDRRASLTDRRLRGVRVVISPIGGRHGSGDDDESTESEDVAHKRG